MLSTMSTALNVIVIEQEQPHALTQHPLNLPYRTIRIIRLYILFFALFLVAHWVYHQLQALLSQYARLTLCH